MKKIINVIILLVLLVLVASCDNKTITKSKVSTTSTNKKTTEITTLKSSTTSKELDEYIEGRKVLTSEEVNSFSEEYVTLFGRTYLKDDALVLDHNGTGIEIVFYGTELKAYFVPVGSTMYYRVYVDGVAVEKLGHPVRNRTYVICTGLTEGVHTVRLVKTLSTYANTLNISNFTCDGKFLEKNDYSDRLNIEFIGDSITCGAGVTGTSSDGNSFSVSDVTQGYAYLTAMELNMNPSLVSCCGIAVDTVPVSALGRTMLQMYPKYSLNNWGDYDFSVDMDICVISLGTNDASYMNDHKNYGTLEFTESYIKLLTLVREKNPNAYIICVYGLMNTDQRIITGIQDAITTFADEKVSYVTLPTDNEGAGAHPGLEGAVKQKDALVTYIKELLK